MLKEIESDVMHVESSPQDKPLQRVPLGRERRGTHLSLLAFYLFLVTVCSTQLGPGLLAPCMLSDLQEGPVSLFFGVLYPDL